MTIYTYFEPVPWTADEQTVSEELLHLWERNWASKGWSPVVLTLEDAKKSPLYEDYARKVMSFPTVNNRTYESACFMRWLAMSQIGGYHCDFDVMNLRFHGGHTNGLTLYSKYVVPAMMWGTKDNYRRMVELFMGYIPKPGHSHVSDQSILVESQDTFPMERRYIMPEFMQEGNWYNYEVVHFPNSRMSGWNMQPRYKYIEMLLDLIRNLK